MSNILDYIVWRGDLPFSVAPLNEVDGLILAQLSMLRWENALEPGQSAKISALFEAMSRPPVSVGFTPENDMHLLYEASHCARFGEIVVRDYAHVFDGKTGMQFAAVTLCLDDGTAYVSFRGTDCSLVGWKEDCDMAFSTPVPSQDAARKYLEAAAARVKGMLRVGGHSKGGNLAMYAAASVPEAIRGRIAAVYSNDGPGLSDRMNPRRLYENISDKLHAFVPQDSIVGMMLDHPKKFTVVRSDSSGIMQHDPYSWQVKGPAFERMPALSPDSARFDAAFRKWLGTVGEEDRKMLIDALFDVLNAAKSENFGQQFWSGLARNPISVLNAIKDISAEKRKRITRMLTELGEALFGAGEHGES